MYGCGDCKYYYGEECNMGPNEGSERYDESSTCDTFELSESAKNTEQQVQPDNAEKEIPFGYYPNNEFEE